MRERIVQLRCDGCGKVVNEVEAFEVRLLARPLVGGSKTEKRKQTVIASTELCKNCTSISGIASGA